MQSKCINITFNLEHIYIHPVVFNTFYRRFFYIVKFTFSVYISDFFCVCFPECLSVTLNSPGPAASSWVLCARRRREQYSWLMTFQARKKNTKAEKKNVTCLVDTSHYRVLRPLLVEKLEQYLFFFFNRSLCTWLLDCWASVEKWWLYALWFLQHWPQNLIEIWDNFIFFKMLNM